MTRMIPKELPVILGSINDVKSLPQTGELAGGNYRQEMELGISHVPEKLMEDPKLNSPRGIETRMRTAITDQDPAILITNTAVYDIRLLLEQPGDTWEAVKGEAFPEGGVTVTIPYPGNTTADAYEFMVVHMYGEDVGGHKAGDIEYLETTKAAEGLSFHVSSLSPVSVGWRLKEDTVASPSNASGGLPRELGPVVLCAVLAVVALLALFVIVRLGILPRIRRKKKAAPKRHMDYRA